MSLTDANAQSCPERLGGFKPRGARADGKGMFDVTQALRELVAKHGSDLHLKAGASPLFRVNGELAADDSAPALAARDTEGALEQLLTDEVKRAEFAEEKPQKQEPKNTSTRRGGGRREAAGGGADYSHLPHTYPPTRLASSPPSPAAGGGNST